jgi:hypothetical protein
VAPPKSKAVVTLDPRWHDLRTVGTDGIPMPEAYRKQLEASGDSGVGYVLLDFCVSAEGNLTFVKMVHPEDAPPDFAAYYSAILKGWKFKPYISDGNPTPFCAAYAMMYTFW